MSKKAISEQLDEVLGGFSKNQMKFVLAMPEYSSKKSCAKALGIDPNTVYNWGKKIDAAIELMQKEVTEFALAMRKRSLVKAMDEKLKGLEARDISVRQKVATEIIEWETGKAMQKTDITSGGEKKDDLPVLPSIPAEMIAPDFLQVHRDIILRRSREYVLKGGRGSTKSSFASLELVSLIVNNPNWHAVAMRSKQLSLRKSVYNQVVWAINTLGLSKWFKKTTSPLEITYKPTGQKIYFVGASDPDAIKGIKLEFGYIAVGWFEEIDQFGGATSIRTMEQSFMRGGEEFIVFKTYNPPPSASNWINKYVLVPKEKMYIHTSDYRNVPIEWLGQPFIDDAEHLLSVNERAYNHEYLGKVTGTGGQVFDNIELREITDDEIAQFDRIYHGLDFGYFPDPLSYGKMHYDKARQTLYIFGEYRSIKQSNRDAYDAILENGYNADELLIADSAEPKSIADYRDYGATIRGAEKGGGSVNYSIKWLQMRKRVVIDPHRAPSHAYEFTEYELEKDKKGEFYTAYPDKNNHSIDDVRYGMNLVWRRGGA